MASFTIDLAVSRRDFMALARLLYQSPGSPESVACLRDDASYPELPVHVEERIVLHVYYDWMVQVELLLEL